MRYFMALKKRETPLKFNKWIIAGVLFIMALTYYLSTPIGCKLYAASVNDYCFKFTLNVNNGKTSAVSNYPVLLDNVDMSFWESNDYIDDFGWSIFPYQGSLTNEYQVLLQDLNNISSNQWYVFPSLSLGDNQLQVLIGADNIQRNQGIYFTGEDYLNVSNHNDFNQSNFRYEIEFEDAAPTDVCPCPTYSYTILDKFDESSNHGLKLVYLDSGLSATIRGTVDGTNLDTISFVPSGENQNIIFSFSGGTLELILNDETPVTTSGTYTTNVNDLTIGAESIGASTQNYMDNIVLRYIDYQTNGEMVAFYGFNPSDMAQTSASDPNYAGSIQDISSSINSHAATYFFNRSQQYISTTASSIVPTSSSGSTIFSSSTPNIASNWYGSGNPGNLAEGNPNFFMNDFLTPPSGLLFPDEMWYTLWLTAFGIVLAMGLFWVFNNIPITMLGASIPLVLGSINGYVTPEYMVIFGLLILAIYSTFNWYERS